MTNSLLSSPTISLRHPEPDDMLAMYALENDTSIWRQSGTIQPVSRRTVMSYVSSGEGDIYKNLQLRLTIVQTCGDTSAVGFVDLFNFSPRHLRAEVGIGMLKEYRGRGYALEALRLLEEYSQQVLFLHQLCATVSADNIPALKLFEACCYAKAGLLTDWLKTKDGFADVCFFQKIL